MDFNQLTRWQIYEKVTYCVQGQQGLLSPLVQRILRGGEESTPHW
jgi:hypothetical protein